MQAQLPLHAAIEVIAVEQRLAAVEDEVADAQAPFAALAGAMARGRSPPGLRPLAMRGGVLS
ncbi:MAG: hypothetical protein WKG00_22705 [Polyangiaceae bacterium]